MTIESVVVSAANIIEGPIAEAGNMAVWQVDVENAELFLVNPDDVSSIEAGPTIDDVRSVAFLLQRNRREWNHVLPFCRRAAPAPRLRPCPSPA